MNPTGLFSFLSLITQDHLPRVAPVIKSRDHPKGKTTGQLDGDYPSVKVPSSQMSNLCQVDKTQLFQTRLSLGTGLSTEHSRRDWPKIGVMGT